MINISGWDEFNSIIQLKDGGYITVGNSYSLDITGLTNKGNVDSIIVEYDKDGNLLWQKNYGGSNFDSFASIAQIKDGGYIALL